MSTDPVADSLGAIFNLKYILFNAFDTRRSNSASTRRRNVCWYGTRQAHPGNS